MRKTEKNYTNKDDGKSDEKKLSKGEIEELRDLFKKYDTNKQQSINKHDIFRFLKDAGHYVDDTTMKKIADTIKMRNISRIDFNGIIELVIMLKTVEEEEDYGSDEYVDAFVALGGNPDRTGKVRKQTIINVIKNEFELAFDMEDFLEKVGATSDELDFQAFCLLFDGRDETLSRAQSFVSLLSERGRRPTSAHSDSFTVKYKDFEKFLAKNTQF